MEIYLPRDISMVDGKYIEIKYIKYSIFMFLKNKTFFDFAYNGLGKQREMVCWQGSQISL